MHANKRDVINPGGNGNKGHVTSRSHPEGVSGQRERLSAQALAPANYIEAELAKLRMARAEVQRIRLSMQRELEMARQIRAKAERYQQETEAKARSQAQMLMLQARLATRKETAELNRKASEEIQKILADIRMIRITAQEELEAQRKFTNAARIRALSQTIQEEPRQRLNNKKEAVCV